MFDPNRACLDLYPSGVETLMRSVEPQSSKVFLVSGTVYFTERVPVADDTTRSVVESRKSQFYFPGGREKTPMGLVRVYTPLSVEIVPSPDDTDLFKGPSSEPFCRGFLLERASWKSYRQDEEGDRHKAPTTSFMSSSS